jgi:hypothetical protein
VSESGTSKYDEVALSRKIGSETGGISCSYFTSLPNSRGVVVEPDDDFLLYFMIRGKAIREKVHRMRSFLLLLTPYV